jgi:pimeloyl-ACP methyl ester carboxylesterase
MSAKWFYRANLDEMSLKAVEVPVLIVPAADPFHPEELAIDLNAILPNAKYIPSPFFRAESEMYGLPGEEHNFGGFPGFVQHLEAFLEAI